MVENRRVGIKSRETYECPAAMALLLAHRDLEDVTLERDVAHEKLRLEIRWAELVYDGMWFSPLKEALDAFFGATQRCDRRGPPCARSRGHHRGGRPASRKLHRERQAEPVLALRVRPGHL